MSTKVIIDKEKCIACGKCVELCPKKILYIDETSEKCAVRDETLCDRSRGCMRVCPTKAIEVV